MGAGLTEMQKTVSWTWRV